MAKNKNYETGYGKPPKSGQFKKGRSGNPKGRPKNQGNSLTILSNVLNEHVTVNENGNRRQISKFEAIVRQLTNKAAMGDSSAIHKVFQLALVLDNKNEQAAALVESDDYAQQQIYKNLMRRMEAQKDHEK